MLLTCARCLLLALIAVYCVSFEWRTLTIAGRYKYPLLLIFIFARWICFFSLVHFLFSSCVIQNLFFILLLSGSCAPSHHRPSFHFGSLFIFSVLNENIFRSRCICAVLQCIVRSRTQKLISCSFRTNCFMSVGTRWSDGVYVSNGCDSSSSQFVLIICARFQHASHHHNRGAILWLGHTSAMHSQFFFCVSRRIIVASRYFCRNSVATQWLCSIWSGSAIIVGWSKTCSELARRFSAE